MEDRAEIRRLHRAENVPIKGIARQLGIARNTVRAALASDTPPKYQRAGKQSLVDAAEPEVRKLLMIDAKMPATVIAQRIGWQHSLTILKDRIRQIRPEYAGVDPADRLVHEPGQAAQMDLWFPEPRIPVGFGQAAMLPVLVMTLTYSRFLSAVMLPSRQAGDLLAGMWQLIAQVGAVSKTLVWDREAAIGGKGVVTAAAAAFAGTLATRVVLAPPRDPEFKGMTERNNGFLETSFLPGRQFVSPTDFNTQLAGLVARRQQPNRPLTQRPPDRGARPGPRSDDGAAAASARDGPADSGPAGQGLLRPCRRERLLRRSADDRSAGGCHRDSDPGDRGLRRDRGRRPRTLLGDRRRSHRPRPRDDREGAALPVLGRETRPGAGGTGVAGATGDVPGHLRLRRAVRR